MSKADAAAQELLRRFGVEEGPIDLRDVVRRLGITLVEQETEEPLNGMLLRNDGRLAIGINAGQPPTGQRFALAHLVGHFCMHRARPVLLDTPDRYNLGDYPGLPTDREESEANRFAGALLMPERTVRRMSAKARFRTGTQLIETLAIHFDLDPAAVGYRLISLGILVDA